MDGPKKTACSVSLETQKDETAVVSSTQTVRRRIVLLVGMGEVFPGSNTVVDVSAGMHTDDEL